MKVTVAFAILVPALVWVCALGLWAGVVLSDWSPEAEFLAYEDVKQCLSYAAPGEELVECEYMIEDHFNMASQNPHTRSITKEEWLGYWEVYVQGIEREQQGQRDSARPHLEA